MREDDELESKLAELRERDHSFKTSGMIDALEWVRGDRDDL
jgi:hypothetical protein